jgi:HSP20 family protein
MTEFNTKPLEDTLNKLGKEIQSFFDGIVSESDLDLLNPRTDFVQTPEGFEIFMDLPGLTKDDIKVELLDDVLTVKGERQITESDDHVKWVRRERQHGRFSRSFPVGSGVNRSGIKAKFKDGVLNVSIKVEDQSSPASTIDID